MRSPSNTIAPNCPSLESIQALLVGGSVGSVGSNSPHSSRYFSGIGSSENDPSFILVFVRPCCRREDTGMDAADSFGGDLASTFKDERSGFQDLSDVGRYCPPPKHTNPKP